MRISVLVFKYKRYKNISCILIPLFLIPSFSCKQKTPSNTHQIQLSGIHKALILNKEQASKAIIEDGIDSFFQKVNKLDMMLQMQQNYPLSTNRDILLNDYKTYIQNDLDDFTLKESEFLIKVIQEAFQLCSKVAYKQFPVEIKMIKTKGKHFGDGVYYTRENSIIIPQNVLIGLNHEDMLHVILHELSHIITRMHPDLKTQLYSLIGFKKLANPLIINDFLKERILTNPDGVDRNWATNLTDENGKNIYALPILYTRDSVLNKNKSEYMQYMNWNFFELTPSVDGSKLEVATRDAQLQSTLNTKGITELFKKQYNTAYIIHPDEIIADNFMYMIYTQKDSTEFKGFTEGGQLLLNKMKIVFEGAN
jgi:hypothetical protein